MEIIKPYKSINHICVLVTTRQQAKDLKDELIQILGIIREQGHEVTRKMDDTKVPNGRVEYIINGLSREIVKSIIVKELSSVLEEAK